MPRSQLTMTCPLTFSKSFAVCFSYFMCSIQELAQNKQKDHVHIRQSLKSMISSLSTLTVRFLRVLLFSSKKKSAILSVVYLLILLLVLKYYKLYKRRDSLYINVI